MARRKRHETPPSRHPFISFIARTVELICGVATAGIIDYSVFGLHVKHWWFHVFSAAGHYTIVKFILMALIPYCFRLSPPITIVFDIISVGLWAVGFVGFVIFEMQTKAIGTCPGDLKCTLLKVLFGVSLGCLIATPVSLILTGIDVTQGRGRYKGVGESAKEVDEEILMSHQTPWEDPRTSWDPYRPHSA